MRGRLHEVSRSRHDDRGPLPALLLPQVGQILVDAAENPRVDRLGRLQDANPMASGKAHPLGAEVRQGAE